MEKSETVTVYKTWGPSFRIFRNKNPDLAMVPISIPKKLLEKYENAVRELDKINIKIMEL
jgi:hypothetical protein